VAIGGNRVACYVRNLPTFLLMTVLCYAPLIVWGALVATGGGDIDHRMHELDSFNRYSTLFVVVLDVPLSAMLTYGVVQDLAGRRATLGACLVTGIKRFLPALLIMFHIFLAVGVISFAVMLPTGNGGNDSFVLVMMCVLGAILLSVYARWFVVVPVSVIEKPGIIASFTRSGLLTAQRRWRLAAVIVLTYVVQIGAHVAAFFLILPAPGDGNYASENLERLPHVLVATFALAALFGSLRAVMAATAYSILRRDKEGLGADELANVFG
jgi:hypothetical protein